MFHMVVLRRDDQPVAIPTASDSPKNASSHPCLRFFPIRGQYSHLTYLCEMVAQTFFPLRSSICQEPGVEWQVIRRLPLE